MTLFLFIALVAGGIFLGLYVWEKQRTEKMRLAAAEMDLPFYAVGESSLLGDFLGFPLFSTGSARKIKNVLYGKTSDVEVALFDYQYTIGGKHRRTYKQTVASIRSPQLDSPEFALRPENLFDKIGGVVGYQDIDFESHPRFSDRYILRGSGEYGIRRLFRDEILAFFESQPGLSVEAYGQRIVFYREAKRVQPENIRSFFEEAFRVYTLFKDRSDST